MSAGNGTAGMPAVSADDVNVEFGTARGLAALLAERRIRVLEDVSFAIQPGEILGLGGESGSGKSTVAGVLCGLVGVSAGQVRVGGQDVTHFSHREWRGVRTEIQLIFQDPFESLNPQFTVFASVAEPLVSLGLCAKDELVPRVIDALDKAELRPPSAYLNRRPTSLSGGERQRVAIARALVVNPSVLVADEPVSMLDPTTAVEITSLLRRLADDLGVAILLISHDLKLLGGVCDRVGIMYLGRLVETGSASDVLRHAKHPYTKLLVSAVPNVDPRLRRPRVVLKGALPSPAHRPSGCPFHPRCPIADGGGCATTVPELTGQAHRCACHRAGEIPDAERSYQ
ncbi:ABC transporter ATP-binding protein [Phytoactinopolyspora alkaliphila]|uniref:ABC transporter ATP-binding protein n=1 Tax=Phytoactinopolyspora alkaliphila TaxID=1783498 RepID=A0A6N9YMU1_9ACTN|nr:ABC transporter ATP-binding protein [Phytoactinopolyspora alkaliphila]NED96381.1 ABC transporter ATP-binding protein [Phytoactinopolyspora alkaliphila]